VNKYESLDIETVWDDNIAKPICIAITDNNEIKFKKVSINNLDSYDIINFMLENCHSTRIYYVHNLTFEMFVFLKYLIELRIRYKIISANKSIYSAEIWYKKKKIRLRCSFKLTMLSLKKLAELSEVEEKGIFPYKILDKNLKDEIKIEKEMFNTAEEYEKFKEKYSENIKVYDILEEYCINDAKITKESIIKYWKIIEENGLTKTNRILTAAKLSIENYFLKNYIIKKKIKLKYDRIIRESYFGGRTEVFGNQKENEILLHYDWSGMYAQCMKEKVLGGEIIESNIIKDLKHPGFYWIKFSQNLEIPILPIKRDKLLFANGEFEGWYWFEEIILAIEYGVKIISIKKMISAQYYDNFIKEFVELNDEIRKISPIHKIIGKNNNNTFYGRLGMNPERLEEEIISEVDKNKYQKIIEINGAFIGYKKKEKSISNVLISASITSKARIKLYRGMNEVIKNDGRILYTDTDSIIAAFKKREYKKKIDVQMGEIKFLSSDKDTVIEEGVFAMPKTYAIRYKDGREVVKIKGFNVKPSFEEFKEKFYNKEEIVTENIEWNKKDLMIRNILKEKRTNLNSLDKRKWKENLKETEPLIL
jgi:DNA polymerase type B, organellar and viral